MGRSAKFAKRPNKAEKVARQINKPIASHNRERSLSPETDAPRSEIPLFNTSAKGRQVSSKPDPRKLSQPAQRMQDDGDDDDEEEAPELVDAEDGDDVDQVLSGGRKKKNLKEKLRQANQAVDKDQGNTERKLGAKYKKGGKGGPILGGKDYVKMLESRPGGAFKHKKLR
ncbi:hypothetical protein JCM11491_000905 [Sporobolomyces phaffii]